MLVDLLHVCRVFAQSATLHHNGHIHHLVNDLHCTCGISTVFWLVDTCLGMITDRLQRSLHCGTCCVLHDWFLHHAVVHLRVRRQHRHVDYLDRGVVSVSDTPNVHPVRR